MVSTLSTATTQSRRAVTQQLMACIAVLILAQALIGALSLSALNRLAADNTADRIELSARQSATHIQTGLNLGKPLAQYFGLDRVLHTLSQQAPGLLGASVVLADGYRLASLGTPSDTSVVLAVINGQADGSDPHIVTTTAGTVRQFSRDAVRLAIPLSEPGVPAQGALVVDVGISDAAQDGLLRNNIMVLAAITAGAAFLLVVLLRYAFPSHGQGGRASVRKAVPILVLLLAQALYASYTIHSFRTVWLDVTQDNARLVVEGVQRDLNQVLSYGISPQKLIGSESYMERVVSSFPVIQELRLHDLDGGTLARASAHGVAPADVAGADDANHVIHMSLYSSPEASPAATISATLDPGQLRAGVWARVLDAGTIAAIAVVVAMELLLLLELAFNTTRSLRHGRAARQSPSPDGPVALKRNDGDLSPSTHPSRHMTLLARPIMFGFLFAWALPLGFLPVYARSLIPVGTAPEQLQFLIALPIVAEMGFGLLTVLLAGRLSDRYGWQRPVLAGLVISIVASVACAVAGSLGSFVAARSLVGVGYGLTWMGLQGYVVVNSPVNSRGRNMSSIIAGLFAGHLSGVAVGAMLMQQSGARAVFYSGALLYVLPLLGALIVASLYRRAKQASSDAGTLTDQQDVMASPSAPPDRVQSARVKSMPAVCVGKHQRPTIKTLLLSRNFGLLLIASIVPFSVAQVGLLSFALPLYLEAGGYRASSVGRVIMIYGLCVIYLGPLMGQLADRSTRKKYWIVAAGLVGSAGLLSFAVLGGVSGAVVAVLCLAIASCLASGAQTAYMLALTNVERYGAVGATSLMRAADKVGQMLGPLIVAGLFAMTSMTKGLVLTGALYFVASLVFMALAPGNRDHRDNTAEHAPKLP